MNRKPTASADQSRRDVLIGTASIGAAGGVMSAVAPPALATPDEMAGEIKKLIGAATVKAGRVKLALPELTENGNSSPLGIEVESPMTAADHVKSVHIFSERNPVAYIARLNVGPRAGRAKLATTIRIAESQFITVLAEMSDGTFWSGRAETVVTNPACIDDSRG
jgi:sulfur-oxidizing protein SoxY